MANWPSGPSVLKSSFFDPGLILPSRTATGFPADEETGQVLFRRLFA